MKNREFENTLLFSTREDLYFVSYNILVMLKYLDCTGKRKFKDVNKIAFLVEFISNNDLVRTLDKNGDSSNAKDQMILSKAYSDGLMRVNTVKRVLYVLKEKGYIEFSDDKKSIWLVQSERIESFFKQSFFKYEKQNILLLKTRIKKLNFISVNKFLDTAFTKNGIQSWANL